MMEESPQDLRPSDAELERWAEVARGRAPPPGAHPLSALFEPLGAAERERMIDEAIARARAPEGTPAVVAVPTAVPEAAPLEAAPTVVVTPEVTAWSRRASIGVLAATLAVAAGLLLVLRTPASSPGSRPGFEIEMHAAAELRGADTGHGETDPRAPVELRLRNETDWVVRAEHAAPRLYLVAHEPGRTPRGLDARIDARRGVFRVRGEVGSLGLGPGEVTVYFVLGPDHAEPEAVRVAQRASEGETPPSGWSVDARRLHIVE